MTRHGRRVGLDLSIRHVMFCLFVFVAALTASSTAAQGPPAGRQGGPPAGREGEHRPRDGKEEHLRGVRPAHPQQRVPRHPSISPVSGSRS